MTNLVVLGLASFYGPAYATRANRQPGCEVIGALAVREDDQLRALGRPTRAEFSDTYGCPVFDETDGLLDMDPDGAIVATPTRRRADDACTWLSREVPVLTAKPISSSARDAKDVAEAAETAMVPAVTTTPARFDDAIEEVGRRIHDGAVGDIVSVRAAIRHDRVPVDGIDWNAEHAPAEAGSPYAMGYYPADLLLWLAPGTPVRAFAEYANVNSPHSAHPDLGTGTVHFDEGAIGTMTMTYSTDTRERLGNWEVEVVGTEGILRTGHQGYEGTFWSSGPPEERRVESFARTPSPILERQFGAFVDALDERVPDAVPPSPDTVARAIQLCSAWERSAETTEPVRPFE